MSGCKNQKEMAAIKQDVRVIKKAVVDVQAKLQDLTTILQALARKPASASHSPQQLLSTLGAGFDDLMKKMFEEDSNSRRNNDSEWDDFVKNVGICAVAFYGGLWTLLSVSDKFHRYVCAKELVDKSEKEIRKIQAKPEPERRDNFYVNELGRLKEKIKSAEAHMKEHKIIGKLVEMFPPKAKKPDFYC